MKIRYDYTCISQKNEIVASGEFELDLAVYSIRSPEVSTRGHFELMNREHERLYKYSGSNHLKEVHLKATNIITGNSRYV